MRVVVVKPDWGIRGGFEVVLERVEADLASSGHDVERVEVAVAEVGRAPFGVDVAPAAWNRAPEWFTHLALLEAFRGLDVSGADLVISSQPPSYAVRHPRHLALFYHHARAFYDLRDVWIEAGRAPRSLHLAASDLLREAERPDLLGVTQFLAGSAHVSGRLREFHGEVPHTLYQAPAPLVAEPDRHTYESVLTVSRHEFTKRTELAVQAAALSQVPWDVVGGGGRLDFVMNFAGRLATGHLDPRDVDDHDSWLNRGTVKGERHVAVPPGLRIRGRVADEQLEALYRSALCVVAPAYDEDYGLTVLEAMAHARPVIVCRDGGGLTELVEDGLNGFVVEPNGAAIAEAVSRLAVDRELARRMGAAGLERVAPRTAAAARAELLDAVDRVAAGVA